VPSSPDLKPECVFATVLQCAADPHPQKIDLAPGIYKTEEGKPFLLSCVKEARQRMILDDNHNHEYGPVSGVPAFLEVSGGFWSVSPVEG
jgi:aspartate/tyrosine/aromatic aminotransferase